MANQEEIKNYIEKLLSLLGINGTVAIEDREGRLVFNIHTEDSAMLIGQYGANLAALQYLVRVLIKRRTPLDQEVPAFILDVENYRKDREEFLLELAKQAALRVRQTRETLVLKPMSSYDRFVIHTYFSKEDDLITESAGEEPERKVVIKLKSQSPSLKLDGADEVH